MRSKNNVPLVLIQRNTAGSAFRYTRLLYREEKETVEFQPVKVGEELPTLTRTQLEEFRTGGIAE